VIGLAAGFEPFADYDLATLAEAASREKPQRGRAPPAPAQLQVSRQYGRRLRAKAATAPQLAVGHGRYSASSASARVIRSLLGLAA
jgi:hypothetical protein